MTSRRAGLVVTGVAVAIAVAWWALVWRGHEQALVAAQDELDAAVLARSDSRRQLDSARSFASDPTAPRQLAALRAQVPDTPDIGGFITLNNTLATLVGMRVESLTPDPPGANDGRQRGVFEGSSAAAAPSTKVTITLTGSDPAAEAYLTKLSSLERLVVVDSFQLTNEGLGAVSLNLVARIFTSGSTR